MAGGGHDGRGADRSDMACAPRLAVALPLSIVCAQVTVSALIAMLWPS
jgi:hypothetical protein